MRRSQLLFLISQAHTGLAAREQIDCVLAALALEQEVSVAFCGDGLLQLLQPETGQVGKDVTAGWRSLELYGVDSVYVHADSMRDLGIDPEQLRVQASVLDANDWRDLLHQQQVVL